MGKHENTLHLQRSKRWHNTMTTELTHEDRQALISYRISRANETLKEAIYNADGGFYNTAVNRLYYSAYYAASALMLAHGISATTHAGIKDHAVSSFRQNRKAWSRAWQNISDII